MAVPWVVVTAKAFAIVRAEFWVLAKLAIWDDNRAAKSVAAMLLIVVSVNPSRLVVLFDDTLLVAEHGDHQNGSLILMVLKFKRNNNFSLELESSSWPDKASFANAHSSGTAPAIPAAHKLHHHTH